MKQAVIKKGIVISEEISAPVVSDGCILIKVVNSCISAGTELVAVEQSAKSMIQKAKEKPEKILQAFNMLKSKGINKLVKTVKATSDSMSPVGYSISGVVLATGSGVNKFRAGDRVAAAGAGLANHAEFVDVPENLVMKIPQGLDFEKASTVTLGGIALQGVRRADLKLGEFCVVTGAGILGLLSVQFLILSGVRVAVIDLDERRLEIAKELGAEIILNPNKTEIVKDINNWTGGYGSDAVLFTAATSSSEPLSDAFQMCKRKGRVILVGVSGMEINRGDIYPKELDFLVSTSYGPGRYDKQYEEKGLDYPYAYVRWTENRNMEEYLRLLGTKQVDLSLMIEKKYSIGEVTEAYSALQHSEKKPLMVILDYGEIKENNNISNDFSHNIIINNNFAKDKINVAIIGAGAFATSVHLPNLQKLKDKYSIYAIVDKDGLRAKSIAKRFNANYSSTDYREILKDENLDLVMICTRHDSHAYLALEGLKAGKHVFLEKPLATTGKELIEIEEYIESNEFVPVLTVGFNRRFSPYIQELKKYTDKRINPLYMHYRVNAGFIPLDQCVHEHGGRIVGEVCHFIDLLSYISGSEVKELSFNKLEPMNNKFTSQDNLSIQLKYEDGSIGVIDYIAVGSKSFPKEFLEVHFDEKTIIVDNFKSIKGYGIKLKELSSQEPLKGHLEELEILNDSIKNKTLPIELNDLFTVTRLTYLLL